MNRRLVTIVLATALGLFVTLLATRVTAIRLTGDHRGYEPVQPIAYSHRLHAGDLQIPCLYCHSAAPTSRHAGIPPATTCMNCHRFVTTSFGAIRAEDDLAKKESRKPRLVVSAELQKLYHALAIDPASMRQIPSQPPTAIAWMKVHRLPAFVYFEHRGHVGAGIACQQCHGPIETMERVRQFGSLSMGWCVNCHRQMSQTAVGGRVVNASIDCNTCHY